MLPKAMARLFGFGKQNSAFMKKKDPQAKWRNKMKLHYDGIRLTIPKETGTMEYFDGPR